MKKRIFPLIIALAIIVISIFSGCASLQKYAKSAEPKASLSKVNIKNIDFHKIYLDLEVRIENPNPVELSLDGFDYKIMIEDKQFLEGKNDKKITLRASGESRFTIPFEFDYTKLFAIYNEAKEEEEIEYFVQAGFVLDIPLIGKQRFPAETKGTIPVVQFPELKVNALKIKKIGFDGTTLEMTASIENPNYFDINMENLKYKIKINGKELVANPKGLNILLAQKKANTIRMPFKISFTELGKTATTLLTDSKFINYELSATVDIKTGIEYLEGKNFSISKKGSIKISR